MWVLIIRLCGVVFAAACRQRMTFLLLLPSQGLIARLSFGRFTGLAIHSTSCSAEQFDDL